MRTLSSGQVKAEHDSNTKLFSDHHTIVVGRTKITFSSSTGPHIAMQQASTTGPLYSAEREMLAAEPLTVRIQRHSYTLQIVGGRCTVGWRPHGDTVDWAQKTVAPRQHPPCISEKSPDERFQPRVVTRWVAPVEPMQIQRKTTPCVPPTEISAAKAVTNRCVSWESKGVRSTHSWHVHVLTLGRSYTCRAGWQHLQAGYASAGV